MGVTTNILIREPRTGNMVEIREEVARFAIEMEKVLKDNDWKGGWKKDQVTNDPSAIPFKGNTLEFFSKKLWEEFMELQEEIHKIEMDHINNLVPMNQTHVLREAADVANIAMMIADNWGELLK